MFNLAIDSKLRGCEITVIEPEPGKQAETLSLMTERARFMARQPGFVSISLHRSLDGRRIVNYVQWKNRDLLEKAHKQKFSQDFLDGRLHSYGDVLVVVPKSVTRATRTARRNIRFETDRPSQMTVSRSFKLCMLIWR